MDTLGDRIRQARESKKMHQSELAAAIGARSAGVISNWENNLNRPDAEKIVKLCAVMDITANWLLGCQKPEEALSLEESVHLKRYRTLDSYGKRLIDLVLGEEYARMTRQDKNQVENQNNITYINCYDLAVSAGTGEPWGDTYYKQRIEIPTERVPENAHFCVRVNGQSMEPAYNDGDIVFVERLEGTVRPGEIGIFFLNGDGYIKRLGDGQLLSLNPDYPPIQLSSYDRLDCQGRVLGKIEAV